MFDIRSDKVFEFIDGVNQSLSLFNVKIRPLKVVDAKLVICNRKDDYHFNDGVTIVNEHIVCEKETEWAIRRMSGTTSFYLELSLNDSSIVTITVESFIGSKCKMRIATSDNTNMFIHEDFVKKVWAGQTWSMDFSSAYTTHTCAPEEFYKLVHPDFCGVLLPTVDEKEEYIKEEKSMKYFYGPKLNTPDEPAYLKEVRGDVVAVSRTSTPGSLSFNPEIVQKVIATLPVTMNDFAEQSELLEAAKLTSDGKDFVNPEKVYTFIERYVSEFNQLAEACTARTGVTVNTVYCSGSSLRPKGYVRPEDRGFKNYTARMLDGLQNIVSVLTEKECTVDKIVIMFCLDHYKEDGATELKLDSNDIQKYRDNIVEIAGEKPWVKIDVQVPFSYNGGQDVIRVYIYEEDKDVCIDYFSQFDTEMFAYVGPRSKGPILNRPIEGGSYEGDVSKLADIIHPDWLKKTSRTSGGSLLDIIKGI